MLFFDEPKIFRKMIFWFHVSLSTPSPPKSPHLNVEQRVPGMRSGRSHLENQAKTLRLNTVGEGNHLQFLSRDVM